VRNTERTPLYNVWVNLKQRCNNPRNPNYDRYGERGISFCQKWESFEKFKADMGEGYKPGLTLDRINNDGDYCKSNCRWVDHQTQNMNTHTSKASVEQVFQVRRLVKGGYSSGQIAKVVGLPLNIVSNIKHGWSHGKVAEEKERE